MCFRQLFDPFSLLSFITRQKQSGSHQENFHLSMPSSSQAATRDHTCNRSSVSSEGFCENEPDADMLGLAAQPLSGSLEQEETDSQGGGS